jgi:DNA-binding transcriptional regulator LsrR (DeoR family)
VGVPESSVDATVLVRDLARLFDVTPVLLPVPGVVASSEVCAALRADVHVGAALAALAALDVAIVAIESARSSPALSDRALVGPALRAELHAAHVVGELGLRCFDECGRFVRTSLDDRIVGATADQLRRTRRLIAVGAGPAYARAVRAALLTGVADVLVTDELTAHALA